MKEIQETKGTVAIVGITGRIGLRVAREMLGRGYGVIGINRRPERVAVRCDFSCPTVKADAGNYEAILDAIRGADWVVMATEPTREHPEDYPGTQMNVLRACRSAGVKQFITVLNYYALQAPDGRSMLEADPVHPYFLPVESSYLRAAEMIRQEQTQDWVIFAAPGEMVPYLGVTGVYRTQENVLLTTDPASTRFKETSRLHGGHGALHCRADRASAVSPSADQLIIPAYFEPPVRPLRATIPENQSHKIRRLRATMMTPILYVHALCVTTYKGGHHYDQVSRNPAA